MVFHSFNVDRERNKDPESFPIVEYKGSGKLIEITLPSKSPKARNALYHLTE